MIRYIAFCFAGLFAGIAGSLAAINFEIANSAYLGATQSGTVLFSTYIGGVGFFIGPIVGAIFVTLLSLGLSDLGQHPVPRQVRHALGHAAGQEQQAGQDPLAPTSQGEQPAHRRARYAPADQPAPTDSSAG